MLSAQGDPVLLAAVDFLVEQQQPGLPLLADIGANKLFNDQLATPFRTASEKLVPNNLRARLESVAVMQLAVATSSPEAAKQWALTTDQIKAIDKNSSKIGKEIADAVFKADLYDDLAEEKVEELRNFASMHGKGAECASLVESVLRGLHTQARDLFYMPSKKLAEEDNNAANDDDGDEDGADEDGAGQGGAEAPTAAGEAGEDEDVATEPVSLDDFVEARERRGVGLCAGFLYRLFRTWSRLADEKLMVVSCFTVWLAKAPAADAELQDFDPEIITIDWVVLALALGREADPPQRKGVKSPVETITFFLQRLIDEHLAHPDAMPFLNEHPLATYLCGIMDEFRGWTHTRLRGARPCAPREKEFETGAMTLVECIRAGQRLVLERDGKWRARLRSTVRVVEARLGLAPGQLATGAEANRNIDGLGSRFLEVLWRYEAFDNVGLYPSRSPLMATRFTTPWSTRATLPRQSGTPSTRQTKCQEVLTQPQHSHMCWHAQDVERAKAKPPLPPLLPLPQLRRHPPLRHLLHQWHRLHQRLGASPRSR